MKKNKLRMLSLVFLLLVLSTSVFAQNNASEFVKDKRNSGNIAGKIIDFSSNIPIEYSNIVLYSSNDSVMVTGTTSNTEGIFILENIKPGNYFLKISFIGFNTVYINDVNITDDSYTVDLGTTKLKPVAYQIDGATVIANKSAIDYHIDKKVINVSEQGTTISGSAVDVLENVPSVNVDIEGNVQLRGSGSFTLLIDGRPTIMDANDALQQIPASTIENIEIVTNPSAKYDPEGVSGIINIKMKKNSLSGISGIINANSGFDERYGGDFIASYRGNGFTFNLGADYRNGNYPGIGRERRSTYTNNLETVLNSNSSNSRGWNGYGINAGLDVDLAERTKAGVSIRFGEGTFRGNSIVNFTEFTNPTSIQNSYLNENFSERGGTRFSSNLNFKHDFIEEGHELSADIDFQFRNGTEFNINEYYSGSYQTDGRKSTEDGPGKRLRAKIDYSLPVSSTGNIETGWQSEFRLADDDTKSYLYNPVSNDYVLENNYSYFVKYSRNIHSLYAIYNKTIDKFGYQVGLRGEYTDRLVDIPASNSQATIDRWDYFPTIHTSYKFDELVQVMASYTRRIQRPRGWYLEPFLTWEDQNNVRSGNPNLQPEYINSFEVAYQTHVEEIILSFESYYRERVNKIERVRTVYDTNVTLRTLENVGTDYTLGAEFMVDIVPIKFWSVNFLGDVSRYRVEGTYQGIDFNRENFNWSLRFNNSFDIGENTKLQFNGRYVGPSISSQADYEPYYSADLSVRQEFYSKALAFTLQVRDIFQSAKREGNAFGPGFDSYTFYQRKSPMVILNISVNLNNFKQKNRGPSNGGGGDDGDGM